MIWSKLMKSLWLLHIDFFIKFSIDESMGDIHRAKMEVLNCCNSKDETNRCLTRCWGKDFSEIKSRTLAESFGHNSSFVAFNRTIRIVFHLKHPTTTNDLLSRRKLDNIPSSILKMHEVLFFSCFSPLGSIWTAHGMGISARINTFSHSSEMNIFQALINNI